jgi:hypothetical protein
VKQILGDVWLRDFSTVGISRPVRGNSDKKGKGHREVQCKMLLVQTSFYYYPRYLSATIAQQLQMDFIGDMYVYLSWAPKHTQALCAQKCPLSEPVSIA